MTEHIEHAILKHLATKGRVDAARVRIQQQFTSGFRRDGVKHLVANVVRRVGETIVALRGRRQHDRDAVNAGHLGRIDEAEDASLDRVLNAARECLLTLLGAAHKANLGAVASDALAASMPTEPSTAMPMSAAMAINSDTGGLAK